MYRIIKKQKLNGSACKVVFYAPDIANSARPGQFVIIRTDEKGERFPLTIFDSDGRKGTVTVVCNPVGVSTGKLCSLAEGEHISDAAGPLGRASRAADHGSAVFVAGGVGVAEIYPVAREMSRGGSRVSVIMGARDKEHMICEEEIRTVSEKVHIITDDGSYGLKGLVTDILPEVLEKEKPELVYAVGPVPMMSKVADMTRDARIKTLVSLDALMVDGTGMCGCCRIRYAGGIKFACYDGPEFDAHLVDFADLMNRAGRYRDKERKALEEYRHRCRSGLHDTR